MPYLEYSSLHNGFKFDEPWDSEHNIKLLDQMPEVYKTSDHKNKTSLMMVVGDGTAYEGKKGFPTREFTDGVSNTILVVRAGGDKAVPWTKTDDLPFQPDDPVAAFGNIQGNYILVVMGNGNARRIPKDIAPEKLRAMLTRNGGETITDGESRELILQRDHAQFVVNRLHGLLVDSIELLAGTRN